MGSITVELLLGNIPERQVFLQKELKAFETQFRADHTYTLITRLHHNVIKTAVKTISLAYSKITFADIAKKLNKDVPEDAEFIVAKAIRDGVIEAELDHEQGIMQSKDTSDVYSTREPQIAFNQRIEFCLDLHNHSVRAMRFPPKSYNKDL